jgi:hypothetical protein
MGLAWYVFYLSDCCDHTDDLQESKLFDVANSLADVMIIMPSMNHESHFGIGPRDLIHSLSRVLSSFRGGRKRRRSGTANAQCLRRQVTGRLILLDRRYRRLSLLR